MKSSPTPCSVDIPQTIVSLAQTIKNKGQKARRTKEHKTPHIFRIRNIMVEDGFDDERAVFGVANDTSTARPGVGMGFGDGG